MKLKDKLDYCRVCENRKTDFERGIVCGLTDEKPAFEKTCPDFVIDEVNADRLADRDPKIQKILNEYYVEKKPKKGFFGRFRK